MIVNIATISVSPHIHNDNFSGNPHYIVVIFVLGRQLYPLYINECGNKKLNQECVSDKQFIALDDLQTSENVT